jgi:hypothetical protein
MSDSDDFPIEFVIGKTEITVLDRFRQIFGVEIRYQGRWQIHQNDVDTYPSDFHAHRKDKAETLDLYTGDVFDPKTRQRIRKLKQKDMRDVYKELQRRDNTCINQKLGERDRFSYLS